MMEKKYNRLTDLAVLLIEDVDEDVDYFKSHVQDAKLNIIRARSVREAHSVGLADICVLDLNIEETIGVETLKQFRKGFPHMPAIVLTHIDDPMVEAACLTYGAYYYLRKEEISSRLLLRSMESAVVAHRNMIESSSELAAAADYLERCDRLVSRIKERMDALRSEESMSRDR